MTVSPKSIAETRQQLRAAMPVTAKWAYFDHAAVAPITAPAAEALQSWLTEAAEEGDTNWLSWAHKLEATRLSTARLIGADRTEIALVPNTTAGINLIAEGIDWQPGDNIVTLDDEFPANVYPWLQLQHRGVKTRRAPTTEGHVALGTIAQLCDSRTRVVSVSWVGYANGCRRDLAAIGQIAHRHGALFFVDAIQGLGVFPLNVTELPIDALSADGHKWLLGPEGAGIAYVRRECLDRLKPIGVGWNSVENAQDFGHIDLKLKQDASRYEGGSHNMAGFLALGASLELLLSLGVDNIAAAILDFTDQARSSLEALGAKVHSPWQPDQRSGIVSFELPGHDPKAVRKHCLKHQVALNCRAGRLRLSAHAYNNQEDLTRLIDALRTVTQGT